MCHYLRRAIAALLFMFAACLVSYWVRSHDSADRLHGRIWGRQSFLLASKQGRVTFLWFRSHGHPNWWKWETHSYPVDNIMSFPSGDYRRRGTLAGFGMIRNPMYFVMPPSFHRTDGTTVMMLGAATATLRGSGVIIPYWFLVLFATAVGYVLTLRRPWQFSTGNLLVMVTLVTVVLGLGVTLDR